MKFSGENIIGFLNNLLISDLLDLEKNTFHYTALCNPKGRIISSMWINIKSEEQISIVYPSNMKNDLLNFFTMRKFRLKLDIQLSDDSVFIKDSKTIITLDTFDRKSPQSKEMLFYKLMFSKNLPWINKDNTEKFIPQHVNLDQHTNIMSFTKGCYPGQEIIARIKYLGKIKKRMKLVIQSNKEQLINKISDLERVSPIVHFEQNKQYSAQVIHKNKPLT